MYRALITSVLLLLPCLSQATDKARIAFVGDLDSLNVGQDGYCGERKWIDRKAWQGVFVGGGQSTWFGIKATIRSTSARADCSGEYSFVPQAANTYIVRYSFLDDRCLIELFRVVPGSDPVRDSLTRVQPQSCLAK